MIKVKDRKDRNYGGTGYARKQGGRNAVSNQNQFGGGRYGIGEETEKATQKALKKANKMKLNKADTGGTVPQVIIKPDIGSIGQTFN